MTDQLDDFFARYRAELAPEVQPAGPGAVRTTVRRRRRIAAVTMAATAVVLVAAPVAGYAALNRDPAPSPVPAESGAPSVSPTPSVSVSPPPTTAPPAPDGRVSRADLLKATVDLPAWAPDAPCAVEDARLTDEGRREGDNWLRTIEYGDVDRDGAEETVAMISCVYLQTGQTQVVAFDRDATGRIVTLGRVVATDQIIWSPTPDQIGWIAEIDPRPDGTVRVEVGDDMPCCGLDKKWVQKQWRTYSWNGSGFEQTGGPTEFGPNPDLADLKVTASDVVLAPDDGGGFAGVVTVTIRNAGPADAEKVRLSLNFIGLDVSRHGSGWAACEGESLPISLECTMAGLGAGEERTVKLGIHAVDRPSNATGSAKAQRDDGTDRLPPDRKSDDNTARFDVR